MTEQAIERCEIRCIKKEIRETDGFLICYSLTEREGKGEFGSIYSVTVSVKKGLYSDEKTAYDITRELGRAEELFQLLVRNTVMPCTLLEILEDIL